MATRLDYKREFDPPIPPKPSKQPTRGDGGDGSEYVFDEPLVLAVNIALATGRPLLLRGVPGSGKSSLARSVAFHRGWRYYADVISSRTQAHDLLWRFDAVRRLKDAQANTFESEDAAYVDPGVLWWAFEPSSAVRRGGKVAPEATDPNQGASSDRAVVLIDEIDKGDPDLPNDLLVPLGSMEFLGPDRRTPVRAKVAPFVVVTTNEERELPQAFVRRCITHRIEDPKRERLIDIARAHFPNDEELSEAVLDLFLPVREAAKGRGDRAASTPELVDAIRACRDCKIKPGSDAWAALVEMVLRKPGAPVA